jgi:hypothetical protein
MGLRAWSLQNWHGKDRFGIASTGAAGWQSKAHTQALAGAGACWGSASRGLHEMLGVGQC